MNRLLAWVPCLVLAGAWTLAPAHPAAQGSKAQRVTVNATSGEEAAAWADRVDALLADETLRVRSVRADLQVPGRMHERVVQYHAGVPVFGGDLSRQVDGRGETLSVFGTWYGNIMIDPLPEISADRARQIVQEMTGVELGESRRPVLTILPADDGEYRLTWRTQAFTGRDLVVTFLDARNGDVAFSYSNLQTQGAWKVGLGRGVLGDQKKMAATFQGGTYVASDLLRPPSHYTYDMKGNYDRLEKILNGVVAPAVADMASDSDNDWTDGAVVDAHTYIGLTYDYFYQRFNRRGLDDNNRPMRGYVHPIPRDEWESLYRDHAVFFTNAFYAGDGVMVFGEGLPGNVTAGGKRWNYVAGALDVVAHELAHGVTDYSSNLIYRNESGALSEAFSDVMSIGAEFMKQPAKADYLSGEDVVTPGGLRNIQDPLAYGNPDHYSRRSVGTGDNGGVQTNSTIASHAFYLAIEGGTNRTSGASVEGVGAARRDQIEKVFYRAFVYLLGSNATFAAARSATIQAARDLYGAGSAAERAVTQAWTAVGVM